jgi:IclR family transcriptional regulator, mhp operon transcriptional activator
MESTRPIRALIRGLDALTVLNLRDGATVSEVAQEIRLPRTTVYRILETLSDGGFVFRDGADDRYRLTVRVRGLSDGVDDEDWVSRIARPQLDELGREIVWPLSLATLSGTLLMVRATTDHETPLAIERYSAGHRMPLLTTAAGRVYLAFCPAAERNALVEALGRSNKEENALARAHRSDLDRMLSEIAADGFASASRTRRLVEEISLNVPVRAADGVLATLGVRFLASSVPLKSGIERFLPQLRARAAKMATLYAEQQAEARTRRTPEAAA